MCKAPVARHPHSDQALWSYGAGCSAGYYLIQDLFAAAPSVAIGGEGVPDVIDDVLAASEVSVGGGLDNGSLRSSSADAAPLHNRDARHGRSCRFGDGFGPIRNRGGGLGSFRVRGLGGRIASVRGRGDGLGGVLICGLSGSFAPVRNRGDGLGSFLLCGLGGSFATALEGGCRRAVSDASQKNR